MALYCLNDLYLGNVNINMDTAIIGPPRPIYLFLLIAECNDVVITHLSVLITLISR